MLTVLEITNNTVDQRSKMQCNGANNVEISRTPYSQGIGMSTNLSLTDAKSKIIIENLEKRQTVAWKSQTLDIINNGTLVGGSVA